MRIPPPPAVLLLLVLAALCSCGRTDSEYVAEVDAWHAARVARLTGDAGWLTLVGLHPLRQGINTVGSAEGMDVRLVAGAPDSIGTLTVGADGILLETAPGVEVRVEGDEGDAPLRRRLLRTDAGGSPTVCVLGSLRWHVIERGDALFLRVKDLESARLRAFAGIARFPVTERWRVTARLEPHEGEPVVAVPNVLGQISEAPSPGVLVFELAGRACRLIPMGEPGQDLFLVFGDATNGETTYEGGRFLSADAPAADGTVVLDFNRAYNPPCAFTPHATCPLPPPGNVLPVTVEAGEKAYGDPHGH